MFLAFGPFGICVYFWGEFEPRMGFVDEDKYGTKEGWGENEKNKNKESTHSHHASPHQTWATTETGNAKA